MKQRYGYLIGLVLAVGAAPVAIAATPGFVEPDVEVLNTHIDSAAASYGWVGAALGDLNSDGVPDYGITAITDSTGGPLAGRAYVYSGADGSTLNVVDGEPFELLGFSMATAGDINSDGVPDYVVGAPGLPPVDPTLPGRAVVFSGSDHSKIIEIAGGPGDQLGTAVGGGEDVNGDGVPDLIVGSQSASYSGELAGRVGAYSGVDGTQLWTVDGKHSWDLMGSAVGFLDDVSGDGVSDLVVGVYGATGRDTGGAGGSGRGEALVLSGEDGSTIHRLKPRGDANFFGRFFARAAGDVDGDGTGDTFVSDYAAGRGGVGSNGGNPNPRPTNGTGTAYVFSGETGKPIHVIDGEQFGEGFGPGRGIGDINGDGHDDLIVAAWTSSEGAPAAGIARIYSGANATVLRTITSTTPGEFLGVDALGVGDLNGDGMGDFLITGFGSAYVVLGTDLG